MLTSIQLKNYKTLSDVLFVPRAVNLLMGTNNAGKTNLCTALRFLSLSARHPIAEAATNATGGSWGLLSIGEKVKPLELVVTCCLPDEDDQPITYEYSLALKSSGRPDGMEGELHVSREKLIATKLGTRLDGTHLLRNENGIAEMLHEDGFLGNHPNSPFYVKTRPPLHSTMLSMLYEVESNRRAIRFQRYLASWMYFNLSVTALRSPDVLGGTRFIRHDGANFSKSLHTIRTETRRLEQRIEESMRGFDPGMHLLAFSTPDPDHVYLYAEDKAGNRFGVHSISDGTLKFLAMACIIHRLTYDREESIRQSGRTPAAPLVIFEEPENGIHVRHLRTLLDLMGQDGNGGQYLLTTHSPYLIDLFDDRLESVFVLRRGDTGTAVLPVDAARVRELLETMPLGEMHFREMLG